MTKDEVEAVLGAPDDLFDFTSNSVAKPRYTAAVYLFPRGLQARMRHRPAMSLPALRGLGLLYLQGRLARIEVGLGYGLESASCPPGRLPSPAERAASAAPPADFLLFSRFATVRLGEPIRQAARRLGRTFTVSTAADFRAFHPAPITLGGDRRLDSFSVSADDATEFEGFGPHLVLHRRVGDCRIDGFAFAHPTG